MQVLRMIVVYICSNQSMNDMKKIMYLGATLVMLLFFTACRGNDEDSSNDVDNSRLVTGTTEHYLLGKWEFVEMLNGHYTETSPTAHTVEFKADGTVIYTFSTDTFYNTYYFPENQDDYNSIYPIIVIISGEDSGFQSYFVCAIKGDELKLHRYITEMHTTEFIPATYIYRRVALPHPFL